MPWCLYNGTTVLVVPLGWWWFFSLSGGTRFLPCLVVLYDTTGFWLVLCCCRAIRWPSRPRFITVLMTFVYHYLLQRRPCDDVLLPYTLTAYRTFSHLLVHCRVPYYRAWFMVPCVGGWYSSLLFSAAGGRLRADRATCRTFFARAAAGPFCSAVE